MIESIKKRLTAARTGSARSAERQPSAIPPDRPGGSGASSAAAGRLPLGLMTLVAAIFLLIPAAQAAAGEPSTIKPRSTGPVKARL